MPEKEMPSVTALNAPFWEAARRHELLYYTCRNCNSFPALGGACTACDNPDTVWVKASGRGTVFTFCVFHRPFHPAWEDDVPYNVAYVKLAEGPLLLTNIVDCGNDDIRVGMPVEVVYDDISDTVTLPRFRPVQQG